MLVRSRRAEILASNIANADTPNYKARDIDFREILKAAQQDSANPLQVSNHKPLNAMAFELKYRQPLQPSLDGNTVDTQVEKAEFTENALQYQASLSFLTGKIKSIMRALKGE
jgi:flagellar basal-body rod protein FlgB